MVPRRYERNVEGKDAGLGFSEERGMVPVKHDDVKICANVNCCGGQETAKETVSSRKAGEGSSTSWEDQLKAGADGPTIIK